MRCEHEVWKTDLLGRTQRLKPCRHRLKRMTRKELTGRLTWHVYRCRMGHETRFYVRP